MSRQLQALILILTFALGAGHVHAKEVSSVEIKTDSLRQLQDLRTQNVKHLQEIDRALGKKIETGATVNLASEVNILQAEKREHLLRQEFLDRLIFQIDTKFSNGDLRAFLETALIDMAKVDAAAPASAGDGLWKFFKYSAETIHRLPEQRENVLGVLEGYMNRSVANPILPEDFLASRNYTNGAKSEQGKPVSREEVGAIADRRIRQLNLATQGEPVPLAAPQTR